MRVDVTDLSRVMAAVGEARGLPNAHYLSSELFDEEKRAVFFANWAGIGFAKDVPAMGDARPVEFLGLPLLVVRDRQGELRVFQNTCRHRGMILVEEPMRIRGAIRCPYHSWCYGLDGALRTTPHIGGPGHNTHPDVDRRDLGLVRIRSHVWRDVIFVNVSGDAPPFERYAQELLRRWQDFATPIYHGGETSSFKLTVATNWKLAIENYCESYHLPWVHPGLNSYSKLEDHYNIEAAGFSGQGTEVYRRIEAGDGSGFPDFPGLSARWDDAAEYVALFPNVLLGVHRDHSFAIVVEPASVERTVEHVELYYATEHTPTSDVDGLRAANAKLWRTVFEEDIVVVEGMQRGRRGTLFDGGRFSPVMDRATHAFHRWVAMQLVAGRVAP